MSMRTEGSSYKKYGNGIYNYCTCTVNMNDDAYEV
jgi:hypothetical protein